jgi:hypothetical protein
MGVRLAVSALEGAIERKARYVVFEDLLHAEEVLWDVIKGGDDHDVAFFYPAHVFSRIAS